MKKINYLLIAVLFVSLFSACAKDDVVSRLIYKGALVLNYGSDISLYEVDTKNVVSDVYSSANQVALGSSVQSGIIVGERIYLMSNYVHKIDVLNDSTLKAETNPITDQVVSPRYGVSDGNFLYVSCFGKVAKLDDWPTLPDSYILKIDLATNEVVQKYPYAGSAEGMYLLNNKLYLSGYSGGKISILDLTTETFKDIAVATPSMHFVMGKDNLLWFSLVNTYSHKDKTNTLGLQAINTTTDELADFISIPTISNGKLAISNDKKTAYVVTSTGIEAVDLAAKTTSTFMARENLSGVNYDPTAETIYALYEPSYETSGSILLYDEAGTLLDEKVVGESPYQVIFNY